MIHHPNDCSMFSSIVPKQPAAARYSYQPFTRIRLTSNSQRVSLRCNLSGRWYASGRVRGHHMLSPNRWFVSGVVFNTAFQGSWCYSDVFRHTPLYNLCIFAVCRWVATAAEPEVEPRHLRPIDIANRLLGTVRLRQAHPIGGWDIDQSESVEKDNCWNDMLLGFGF